MRSASLHVSRAGFKVSGVAIERSRNTTEATPATPRARRVPRRREAAAAHRRIPGRIDRDLNYIVFDTRLNDHIERYVLANGLDSAEGQRRFREAGETVDFPRGHYEEKPARTGGALGSIAVKTSWKVMVAGASGEARCYYTVIGRIAVPAARSETGKALCVKTRLGLLGMHIMHRTESGNGGDWIWSTFEHADAAPIADNALVPNNILGELFAGGCRAESVESQRYVLFNPPLARDQVKLMRRDNVVGREALNFGDPGVRPVSLDEVLPDCIGATPS